MKNLKQYQWILLAALFIVYFASNGIMQNTMPTVLRAAATEFGIDPAKSSKLPGLVFFIMAVLLPFVGFLATKVSPKILMTIGGVVLAGAILYYPYVTGYGSLQLYYVVFAIGLTICGLLTSLIFINQWFGKNIGLAIGIFLNASSIGAAVFNPIAGTWIKELGWRTAASNLSYISAALLLIPLFFIFVNEEKKQLAIANSETDKLEFKRHLFSVNYLVILVITILCWFVITGFIFNQQFYLQKLNLDAAVSGKIAGLFFLCSLLGKILFGFLGDKFNKRIILMLSIVSLIVGILLLQQSLNNSALIYPTAIAMGIGYSGCFTMIQAIIAYFYKGNTYSKLLGFATMADTLAASFGIILTAKWAKESGGYAKPFQIYLVLAIIALVLSFFVKSKTGETNLKSN